ncbi:MAG TPA: hypothetical protein DCF87_09335 [Opitutae bacterium]|nr:hypothetical protein [Opitutae bacterium]
MKQKFTGIWIPSTIWSDERLNLFEKVLLSEIMGFGQNESGFFKSNEVIQQEYKTSRPTISKAIQKLEELNLIEVSFNGRVRRLFLRAEGNEVSGRRKESFRQKENPLRAEGKNSTSKNRTENKTENKIEKQREEVFLPWDSESFKDLWSEWIDERKQRRYPKYTNRGLKAVLFELQKLSNDDEQQARQIILQSISKGWRGFFAIKGKTTAPNQVDRDKFEEYIRTGSIQGN